MNEILREALKLQQEIYGDLLYTRLDLPGEEVYPVIEKTEFEKPVIEKPEKNVVKEKTEIIMKNSSVSEDWQKSESLEELYDKIHTCLKCPLGETRNKFVFGDGNNNADVMLIGEAPGAEEDKQGLPFVGRAGKLLNDILKAIGFAREEVYIGNINKCRPPGNRNPETKEVEACIPYLYKQIELIKPKVILCLGLVAAENLLRQKKSLTKYRGDVFEVNGVKVMVTYHPAALLRNPNWKRGAWEDVQKFRKLYDESISGKQ